MSEPQAGDVDQLSCIGALECHSEAVTIFEVAPDDIGPHRLERGCRFIATGQPNDVVTVPNQKGDSLAADETRSAGNDTAL